MAFRNLETASSIALHLFFFCYRVGLYFCSVGTKAQGIFLIYFFFSFSFPLPFYFPGLGPFSLKVSVLESSIPAPPESPWFSPTGFSINQILLNVSCVSSWVITVIFAFSDAANRPCIVERSAKLHHHILAWLIFNMEQAGNVLGGLVGEGWNFGAVPVWPFCLGLEFSA